MRLSVKKYIQQCKRIWPVVAIGLFALVTLLYAATPSRYYIKGLFTLWAKTDTSLAVNLDTTSYGLRNYIKFWGNRDSNATSANDYTIIRMYGVLGTTASDSVNLQVGVNGVYEALLLNYNMYAFNFALLSTQPSNIVSTFRQDLLPMISGDSLYIFRVSRNVTMTDTCAISIYKVPLATGPDVNDKTAGTFYDMVRFSGIKLTNSGNKFFTVDIALRRKP